MVIRRNIRRKPPVDKFLHSGTIETRYNQLVRALYVNMRPDDMPPLFRCTHNRLVLADLKSYGFWLEWSESETVWCRILYGFAEMIDGGRNAVMTYPPVASYGRLKVVHF